MNAKLLVIFAAAVSLSGCHSLSEPEQAVLPDGLYLPRDIGKAGQGSTFYFTHDFQGARVHGTGVYRYRLVLIHPVAHDYVMPNQPYALSHSGINLPFVPEEKDVFQGVTDSQGRTDVFAFEHPVDPKGWNLRQRTGKGSFGEQMVIRDFNKQPFQGVEYALVVCGKKAHVYRGLTDRLGQAAYVASPKPANILLYAPLFDEKPKWQEALREKCGTGPALI